MLEHKALTEQYSDLSVKVVPFITVCEKRRDIRESSLLQLLCKKLHSMCINKTR